MIQVSNEFKTAIKKPERKIKGYVEVLYDLPNVEVTATTTIESQSGVVPSITDISEIVNGKRVSNNYGTLDYLPLDGSVLVMDESDNINSGYISGSLAGEIDTYFDKVTLTFEETTINGITAYYEDNFPEAAEYTLSDGTTGYFTGDEIQQAIFSEPKTITSITIEYNLWRYEDRKIRINEIDLGITQVYKDQDLIDFTIDEEVNKLVEEVPINETNITLNNISDLFNPLNPKGIVPYLSENTLIKPYIGVLTENLGIEYVKMGEFYFDSYTNNSDATTTLVGKNLIKQLEQETLKDDNEFNLFQAALSENEFDSFMQNYNYTYTKSWTRNCGPVLWQENSLLKFLSDMAFWQENLFYINRDNIIINRQINTNLKDSLTKNELINDVDFKYIEKINTLKITKNTRSSGGGSTPRELIKETVTLEKNSQIFVITSDSPDFMFATVSQTGGTSASIITAGFYMAFVKVTGNIGDSVELTFTTSNQGNVSKTDFYITNKGNNKEKAITFDSGIYYMINQNIIQTFNLLSKTPSYEMKFEYNGDPSLEAGDYINVETPYGYKKLFIQKNRFKFDGGLEGSIEGVE